MYIFLHPSGLVSSLEDEREWLREALQLLRAKQVGKVLLDNPKVQEYRGNR